MNRVSPRQNSECLRIADQLKRCFHGPAWHGPALLEVLADVDAKAAARRAVSNAHTIWEIVLHISGWERVVLRRLDGKASTLEGENNFPAVSDVSDHAWNATLERLKDTHEELTGTISAMRDSRLADPVPGKDYDVYFMVHGSVQHALYHAGQIAIMKKT